MQLESVSSSHVLKLIREIYEDISAGIMILGKEEEILPLLQIEPLRKISFYLTGATL